MRWLITGLGNHGTKYEGTRHNIGFAILDALLPDAEAPFQLTELGFHTTFPYAQQTLHLLKPTTYMNNSGRAVAHWVKKLQIPFSQLLVVVDDLHLSLGTLRLRPQGSSGGHNGLKSIEAAIGTTAYPRLRFGIDRHFPEGQQARYVLDPFTPQEAPIVAAQIEAAIPKIFAFCQPDAPASTR